MFAPPSSVNSLRHRKVSAHLALHTHSRRCAFFFVFVLRDFLFTHFATAAHCLVQRLAMTQRLRRTQPGGQRFLLRLRRPFFGAGPLRQRPSAELQPYFLHFTPLGFFLMSFHLSCGLRDNLSRGCEPSS